MKLTKLAFAAAIALVCLPAFAEDAKPKDSKPAVTRNAEKAVLEEALKLVALIKVEDLKHAAARQPLEIEFNALMGKQCKEMKVPKAAIAAGECEFDPTVTDDSPNGVFRWTPKAKDTEKKEPGK